MTLPIGNDAQRRGYRDGWSTQNRSSIFRRTAITFLELLLTMVIVSVLVGSSLPLVKRNIQSTSFKSFVNKTYLFLDYSKTQAILKDIVLEVRLDVENNSLFLSKRGTESDERLDEIQIPNNIHLDLDKEKIVFYPDGTSQEFKFVISDKHQRHSTISSKGFDGKIVVDVEK
ncbi:MAG: hypothetical protein JSW40_01620 [Candidatus Omnitrophota bacterium]|nr:MAG: hypothetical protein JSW40_01620 [Candidatus Omnitrophota bacterium]